MLFKILNYLKKIILDFFSKILKFLYPSFCCFCKDWIVQNDVFCAKCWNKVKPVVSIIIFLTKNIKIKIFAVSDYKDPMRFLILQKSFAKNILASKQLANIIYKNIPIKELDIDYIVPIPLHWTRLAWRGYNQSYIMSKVLSKKLNIPILNILKRTRRTIFQSQLSFKERQLNVDNVFSLRKRFLKKEILKNINNKKFLVVDDLYTTGATIKNVSKPLLQFNPISITAVVACRVI